MYHVSRMPALYRLSVEVEMEMQVLHVIYLLHGNPRSHGSTSVKALGQVPGKSLLCQLPL